jgi:hypothetical protein
VLILDDLLAGENPRSEKNVQVLALHPAAEGRKTADIRNKKPAWNILDFPQRSLYQRRFVLVRNGNWLPEHENLISDCDLIAVAQSDRVMNALLVQKGSVTAAEIDQPKFANILKMNKRMPARHFGRFQHDRAGGGPPERTTAMDRIACAIGRFQPGTFLLGGVHAEESYQEAVVGAKSLLRRPASSKQCQSLQRR